MNEIFIKYINKDCIIYMSNGLSNVIQGNVTGVSDNWITIRTKDGDEIVNIDYITHIKEHPVNKNGKKKSIIF
ncbi:MAG: hypothetical protein U0M02_12495 [Acutalibacteraceae bacterium]|nr:hypothetical protein [Acutalibacteraceae bacterium]